MPQVLSRRLLIAAGLTVAAGCTDSGTKPGLAPVQVRGRAGAGTVTVATIKWSKEGEDLPPRKGYFLSLKLICRATEGVFIINPAGMSFIDSRATERSVAYWGADVEPSLRAVNLSKGSEASGWVSFDVPPGEGHLIILNEGLEESARILIPGP